MKYSLGQPVRRKRLRPIIHRLLAGGDAWGVSVLGEAQDQISTRFARSGSGNWSGFEPIAGVTGVPLPGALAHFECERHAVHEGGDHLIFIGRVLALRRPLGAPARPLVFFAGRYHQLDRPRLR